MHDIAATTTVRGRAEIDRGKGPLARIAAVLVGFPPAGKDVPVEVRFEPKNGGELWTRTFAGHAFSSVQEEGRGRFEGLLVERFGPIAFGLAVIVEDGRLRLVLRRWTALGIPLPLFLAPRSNAFEEEADGRFRFHVEIAHPLTGLIVRYRGWLEPD